MISILIGGDFCPRHRVSSLIEKEDYKSVFNDIRPITGASDYSVLNLEAPVLVGDAKPISKTGPNLKCSPNAVEAIKYAGFGLVTLANNHFYDYGEAGVRTTLEICSQKGIDVVGGGKDEEAARKIHYKVIKDITVAFINVCESEWSIASECKSGSNALHPVRNFTDIIKAKSLSDYVIVIVHGGHEHFQLPSPRMKETYRFFIDAGADAVINHHQHCYSGYEIYSNKPIFYGLGNFCFDTELPKGDLWYEGYLAKLFLDKNEVKFEVIPYIQGHSNPGPKLLGDKRKFFSKIAELNKIIADDTLLSEHYNRYIQDSMSSTLLKIEPYKNKYLRALRYRGFLPSIVGGNWWRKRMLNLIRCESHKDLLQATLERVVR